MHSKLSVLRKLVCGIICHLECSKHLFAVSKIRLRTELCVILLDLNPMQYRKAVCSIDYLVYHGNVETISCFCNFLIFSQSYIFNFYIYLTLLLYMFVDKKN